MTWIILQFVFLAMPVVLPALLYRSRRYFMAKFYDKMIWSEKARRLYTHVLLIVLLLFHYVYTSGHPGEFGVVPSTIVCAAWASFRRADRWMRCLLDRPKRFVWFALLALVIGFVPHLYTMSVTIALFFWLPCSTRRQGSCPKGQTCANSSNGWNIPEH